MSRPAEPPWTPADPAGAPADPPAGPWRAPTGPTRAPDDPTEDWRRLDPRTISASAVLAAGALVVAAVPVGFGLLLGGVGIGWVLLWTIGGVLLGSAATAVAEAIRLAVTGYRVDAHRIDRRVGSCPAPPTASPPAGCATSRSPPTWSSAGWGSPRSSWPAERRTALASRWPRWIAPRPRSCAPTCWPGAPGRRPPRSPDWTRAGSATPPRA